MLSQPTSDSLKRAIRKRNERLLELAGEHFGRDWITPEIRNALHETPRHLFIPRILSSSSGSWNQITDENVLSHLDVLYQNQPLCIYRDDRGRALSTISQPTLVLYMLSLLDLKPGQKVFELGGGSGWNAAMMGRLVAPGGQVFSLEIIPDLVDRAQRAIKSLGIDNVAMLHADAYVGLKDQAPFDRGVFTASAHDLPRVFFEQMAENSLLLFVTPIKTNADLLALLRKRGDRFESEFHFLCRFVPVMMADQSRHQQLVEREDTSPSIQNSMSKEMARHDLDIEDMQLGIVSAGTRIEPAKGRWIDPRGDSTFIWQLPDL